jgi:uncharacterized protein
MRIELDRLQETGDRFSHRYEPEELVLDEGHARLTEPPEVTGRVQTSGREVRVRGKITARAEVDCDRCLKSVETPVETEFDVSYVPEEDYRSSEAAELQEEDMSLSVFDGETIDVDELVREQLLLALPTRALCTEECKGLCPTCGADLNADAACGCETKEVDPRWAALKSVMSDE